MIDVHYTSLASRRVQHRMFYLDGHPSRYQPRPIGLNFGEQTGTGVFPLVIAVPHHIINLPEYYHHLEQTSNDKHSLLLFLLIKREFVW